VKTTPLDRTGAYIPSDRAAYLSTVLMTTIAARVAGIPERMVCTPSPVHSLTLVAFDIAGAGEAYKIGWAQAVAATVLGTETIKQVQEIVGPGNVYVTQAKLMLHEYAEIDFQTGPSEIGIIADSSAKPAYVAADTLAQAEHDPNTAGILVTDITAFAIAVGGEIVVQIATVPRHEILERALAHSGYVIVGDKQEAIFPDEPRRSRKSFDPDDRSAGDTIKQSSHRLHLHRLIYTGCLRRLYIGYESCTPDDRLCKELLLA
jgi:histidinol dehydrogenase